MKSLTLKLVLLAIFCLVGVAHAQVRYTPADIHSHNDYSRPEAFYKAFKAGVGYIEADVFLRNGKLMVAHDTAGISAERTLKSMYLDPLLSEPGKQSRAVNLVVDLKEAYGPILAELLIELKPLQRLIKTDNNNGPLSIIITGDRPSPAEYGNYPAYITFDDDLQLPHNTSQWKRVAQVSLNFANYSKWKGDGVLPSRDEKVLKSVINAVHISGKRIRFWGAADNAATWQKLMELQADILSTDKIDELKAFISR